MSNKLVKFVDKSGDILNSDFIGVDLLTGEEGFQLQKFSEILTANIMQNALRMLPLKYSIYLVHHNTNRNNKIGQDNTYQNYNFGISAPSTNQNNTAHYNCNWFEYIKTDENLDYFDAIKIHAERNSYLTVRAIMYFTDATASDDYNAFGRLKVDAADGTSLNEVTLAKTVHPGNRNIISLEAGHKVQDGAVITLQMYGKTTATCDRLCLSLELQELLTEDPIKR